MNKRFICVLILTVMLLSLLPVYAFASTVTGICGVNGNNLEWEFNSSTGQLSIKGSGKMANYSYKEGSYAPWRNYKDNINSIVISDGVKSIGEYAFYQFGNLTNISIPDSVTYIGKDAFKLCTSLTSFTAPNGITEITRQLFHDCTALSKVVLHKRITVIHSNAFENCTSLTTIEFEGSDNEFLQINFKDSANKGLLKYNPNVVVDFKGGHTHELGEYTPNNDGSCQEAPTESATCKFEYCNYAETRVDEDAPVPHWFAYYLYNNDETYEKNGTETAKCRFECGASDTREKQNTRLADSAKLFTDVPSGKWYTQYIDSAVGRGLFNGVTDTTFEPNTSMTRAMFVTVLYRLSGDSFPAGMTGFSYVPTGKYYSVPVKWASNAAIVTGVTKNTFEPNTAVTREQLCTMLVRYADYKGIALDSNTEPIVFTDNSKISKYAVNSVYLCQRGGIVNGVGNGNFEPKKTATRAEVSKIPSLFYKYNLIVLEEIK